MHDVVLHGNTVISGSSVYVVNFFAVPPSSTTGSSTVHFTLYYLRSLLNYHTPTHGRWNRGSRGSSCSPNFWHGRAGHSSCSPKSLSLLHCDVRLSRIDLDILEFCRSVGRSRTKKLSASGGLRPLTPYQGLWPWTPLGAPCARHAPGHCLLPQLSNTSNAHAPTRSLRSANTNLLSVPRVRTTFASRGFSIAAPTVWNSLPSCIRSSTSADTFRRFLKTHCFQQAY